MTIEEIESTLPNGFHDAEVRLIMIDYVQRKATLELFVFVGSFDAPPARREAYKEGSLEISGLLFAVIEPPDPSYPFTKAASMRVAACDMKQSLNSGLLSVLPKGSFVQSFFVTEWNSFIHLAGMDADLAWKGETAYRSKHEHFLPGETIEP